MGQLLLFLTLAVLLLTLTSAAPSWQCRTGDGDYADCTSFSCDYTPCPSSTPIPSSPECVENDIPTAGCDEPSKPTPTCSGATCGVWQCGAVNCSAVTTTCHADNATPCTHTAPTCSTQGHCGSPSSVQMCSSCPTYWSCDLSSCATTAQPTPACLKQDGSPGTGCTGSASCACGSWKPAQSHEATAPESQQVFTAALLSHCKTLNWDSCQIASPTPPTPTSAFEHVYACFDASDTVLPSSSCSTASKPQIICATCSTWECELGGLTEDCPMTEKDKQCDFAGCPGSAPSVTQFTITCSTPDNSEIYRCGTEPVYTCTESCPSFQWVVVDASNNVVALEDYQTEACNFSGCATTPQTTVTLTTGYKIECHDGNGDVQPDQTCTTQKPTVPTICGACGTYLCSFVTHSEGDTITETVPCAATTCNTYYPSLFGPSALQETSQIFTDCAKTAKLPRNAYCVANDANVVVKSSLCPTASTPSALTCDTLCQVQCAWKLSTASTQLTAGEYTADKCSWTCSSDSASMGFTTNCGTENSQQHTTCAPASGYNGAILTYTAAPSEWTHENCGSTTTTMPITTTCNSPCGAYRCVVEGRETKISEDSSRPDGLCSQTTCSAVIAYVSSNFSSESLVDDTSPQCYEAKIGTACFTRSGTTGSFTYTYDSTNTACALITDTVTVSITTCPSKACYGMSCGYGPTGSGENTLTYDPSYCSTTYEPVCECSCAATPETPCASSDYTLVSLCQLNTNPSTPVTVDETTDPDRYSAVCNHLPATTKTCVTDITDCPALAAVTGFVISPVVYMYQASGVSIKFKYNGPRTTTLTFHITLSTTDASISSDTTSIQQANTVTYDYIAFRIAAQDLVADGSDSSLFTYIWDIQTLPLPVPSTAETPNQFEMYAIVSSSQLTAETAARSSKFTIGTFCQYQLTLPAEQRCSGEDGATCVETANLCTCPAFLANPTYFPTTRDCSCPDINPTAPTQCTFEKECPAVVGATTCLNGFQTVDTDGACSGTCICTGGYTGTACDECSLETDCGSNGAPNSQCTACICSAGFGGQSTCQYTKTLAFAIVFTVAPTTLVGANKDRWQNELLHALIEIIGIDDEFIGIPAPATLPPSSFIANLVSPSFTLLSVASNPDGTLTARLSIVVDETGSPTTSEASDTWKSKVTTSAINSYPFAAETGFATIVAGPCAGVECTDSEITAPTTEPDNDDGGPTDNGTVIVIVVVVVGLILLLIVIVVVVVCCADGEGGDSGKKRKKNEKKNPDKNPSSASEGTETHLELM